MRSGHASLIDEVAQAGRKPDAVVLSVGGGGLLSGVVEGLHRNGWHDVPVIAVETEGAASFRAASEAGHAVEIERISSIATSLGPSVCVNRLPCTSVFIPSKASWSPIRMLSMLVSDSCSIIGYWSSQRAVRRFHWPTSRGTSSDMPMS